VKFEIIREARLNLTGAQVAHLPVACLNRSSAVAENSLANVNRGLEMAETAYGDVVLKLLNSALKLISDDSYRKQGVTELEIGQKQKTGNRVRSSKQQGVSKV